MTSLNIQPIQTNTDSVIRHKQVSNLLLHIFKDLTLLLTFKDVFLEYQRYM
jgi:hypothetical protein